MSLLLVFALVAAILIVCLLLHAAVFWGATRLLRFNQATFVRALVVVFVGSGISFLVNWAGSRIVTGRALDVAETLVSLCVLLVASLVCASLFVRWAYGTSLGKALAAWVGSAVVSTALSIALVVPLRLFACEGFVVPTGAMATAVLGTHSDVTCENCGWQWAVTMSDRNPDSGFVRPGDKLAECPNCHHTTTLTMQVPLESGDRVLVEKLSEPRRWDVVVFPFPEQPQINYIKRLVGLPGESVSIYSGDLFVDGERLVKRPDEQLDMWIAISDSQFVPKAVNEDTPRWHSAHDDSPWRQDGGVWTCDAQEQVAWLDYTGPIDDRLAYNARRPEEPLPDFAPVRDVLIEATLQPLPEGASLAMQWRHENQRVTAQIAADGQVTLRRETLPADDSAQEEPSREQPSVAQGKATHVGNSAAVVALAIRDGVASLMEDRQVIASLAVDDPLDADSPAMPTVRIGASGGQVKVDRIRLARDVYYLTGDEFLPGFNEDIRNSIELGDDELFTLGDNSRNSQDSRFWGPVKHGTVIGVARWIYWPAMRWRTLD